MLDSRWMNNTTPHKKHLRLMALFIIPSLTAPFIASAQESSTSPLPESQIHETASRILSKADKADCKPHECKILVGNFTFASGLTSQLGVQLADQFSKELASQQNEIQLIDRSALRAYLDQQRIPGVLLNNEKAMRWLGKQLGGTSILTGLIEDKASSLHVKLQLLSCDKEKARLKDELLLPPPSELNNLLTGVEAFPQNPLNLVSPDSSTYRAGVGGVTQPACTYCPDPDYTKAALEASFSGTILMDVLLSAGGQATQITILRGAPFALNEAAMSSVHRWKFKPATLNGKPVPVRVVVEIGMRRVN